MELSEFVEKERKKQRMSIRALAKNSGISISTLQRIEKGERKPSFKTIKMVCDYFKDPLYTERYFLDKYCLNVKKNYDADFISLGYFIKSERIKRNMSLHMLADESEICFTTLYNMENDKCKPSIDTIKKVCVYFQNSVYNEEYFFKKYGYDAEIIRQMSTEMTIGRFIKKNREEHGMSQKVLASKLDMAYQTIGYMEKDSKIIPTIATIKKICAYFSDSLYNELFFLKKYGYVEEENPEIGIDMSLGRFTRNEINRINMSLQTFSNESGVAMGTLCKIINKNSKPSVKVIGKVCTYFPDPIFNELYFLNKYGYSKISVSDHNIDFTSIASFLRNKRIESNITLDDLANNCQIPIYLIWRIENDLIYRPSIKCIKKICGYFPDSVYNESYFLKKYGYYDVKIDDETNVTFTDFLKFEQFNSMIALKELSKIIGVSSFTLYHLLNNCERKPSKKIIKKVCKVFPHSIYNEAYFLKKYGYTDKLENILDADIGSFVKYERIKNNVSLQTLAQESGVYRQTFDKMEKNSEYVPTMDTIKKVCAYFLNPIYNEEYFLKKYGYLNDVKNKKINEINVARQKLLNVLVNLQAERVRMSEPILGYCDNYENAVDENILKCTK